MPEIIRLLAAALIPLACMTAQPVHAQNAEDFAACTGIDNDIERLACFDRVAGPLKSADGGTEKACATMSVEDLKLDYKDLLGKCATVTGFVMQAGDIAMLMQSQTDASPFFIETATLSRDERRILLNCATGCQLTVTGTVGEFNYNKGMKADSISE